MLYNVNASVYWRLAAPKRYEAWKRTLKIVGPGEARERLQAEMDQTARVVCYNW